MADRAVVSKTNSTASTARGSAAMREASAAYMRTNPVNEVRDEPTTPSASKPITWSEYQAAVLARADLTADDKLVFVELVRRADYKGGGNCAPKLSDVAARYGKSVQWARRAVRHLRARGVIAAVRLRSRRRLAQNLYRFVGHEFDGPVQHGKLKHVWPGPTPRTQQRDAATGRFVVV